MGRNKGQVEKFDFSDLRDEDRDAILRFGKIGIEAWLKGLRELQEQFNDASALSEGLDLTPVEHSVFQRGLNGFFEGVLEEIEKRKSQDGNSHVVLNLLVELLSEHRHESPNEQTQAESGTSRLLVQEAYVRLKSSLGRRPSQKELMNDSVLRSEMGITPTAIARAATRLSLPLCDLRIRDSIGKTLNKFLASGASDVNLDKYSRACRKAFQNVKTKSPESDRLRTPLKHTSLDRMIEICADPLCWELLEKQVEHTTCLKGVVFDSSEEAIATLTRGSRLEHLTKIQGSTRSADFLFALHSLAKLWRNTSGWVFDTTWMRFEFDSSPPDTNKVLRDVCSRYELDEERVLGGLKASYKLAVDSLILSLSAANRRFAASPSCWLIEAVVKHEELKRLTRQAWRCVSFPRPLIVESTIRGIDALLEVLSSIECKDKTSCQELGRNCPELLVLIDLLEPFDWVLKAKDYGFNFSATH